MDDTLWFGPFQVEVDSEEHKRFVLDEIQPTDPPEGWTPPAEEADAEGETLE